MQNHLFMVPENPVKTATILVGAKKRNRITIALRNAWWMNVVKTGSENNFHLYSPLIRSSLNKEKPMARKPRFTLPGVPQHVIQRGNNREPCFFASEDFRFYLDCLKEAFEKYHCAVHAYVLMTNHVHLLVTPQTEAAVGNLMQSIGRRYVRYVNHTYRRSGTLWEGRYKASLVESETYLLACQRYIELNPVRAGMVAIPGDYRWSSYAGNAFGKADGYLTPHPEFLRLDADPEQRRHVYRELFRHHMENDLLHTIREALNQELVLGSERFKDKIEATLKRRARPGLPGRPRDEGVGEEAANYEPKNELFSDP